MAKTASTWSSVHLVDGSVEHGVVHTVDPETSNVVLLRPTVRARPLPRADRKTLRTRQ